MEMIILLQTENYDTVKNKQQKQKNSWKKLKSLFLLKPNIAENC